MLTSKQRENEATIQKLTSEKKENEAIVQKLTSKQRENEVIIQMLTSKQHEKEAAIEKLTSQQREYETLIQQLLSTLEDAKKTQQVKNTEVKNALEEIKQLVHFVFVLMCFDYNNNCAEPEKSFM